MRRDSAVILLKSMRNRAEAFHGLLQAGPKELIALYFAYQYSKDPAIPVLIPYLSQGIVILTPPLFEGIRQAYKTLEKLPSTAEYVYDAAKGLQFDAPVKNDTPASDSAHPGKETSKFEHYLSAVNEDFNKFFKDVDDENGKNEPPEQIS